MTSLGDINHDGYTDVAIGAPYEGGGAIYIYLGSANGLVTPYSQVRFANNENEFLTGGIEPTTSSFHDKCTKRPKIRFLECMCIFRVCLYRKYIRRWKI